MKILKHNVRIWVKGKAYIVSNYLNLNKSRVWKDSNKLGMLKCKNILEYREAEIQERISDIASRKASILSQQELDDLLNISQAK